MTTQFDLSSCSLFVNNKPVLLTQDNQDKLYLGFLMESAGLVGVASESWAALDSTHSAKFYADRQVEMYNPWVGTSISESGGLPKGARFVFLENNTVLKVQIHKHAEAKPAPAPVSAKAVETAECEASYLRKVAVYGALVAAKIQEMHRLGRSPVSPTCLDVIVGNAQQEAEQVEEALQRRMSGLSARGVSDASVRIL